MSENHSLVSDSRAEAQDARQDLLQKFLLYLRYERNASEKTIREYGDDLAAFNVYVETAASGTTWETLDADIIRQWVIDMMDRGHKATSVNRRLSALRSFYKFLLRREYVTVDPAHNVVGPKNERRLPSYVRDAEMNQLLDGDYFPQSYTGVRDHAILLTLYSTGLRASELTGLRLADVDLEAMQLKVTGKRNKQRIIPFGAEMRNELENYLCRRQQLLDDKGSSSERFFLNGRSTRPMSYTELLKTVHHYLELVTTAKKRSPHTLRHTFATSMLNHHADLRSVKELLGHESLATTEIYTHTSFADLQNAYQMAHPRERADESQQGD